ncbi:MAG: thymidine kinase [Candidatus Neomarinimicrobiota bacterium]|nr:MAG: thymidine kinase [Candidatus Neomarinimicrobiota bacterium]
MPPHIHTSSGWIEVICGSMFSGKTEELIRRLRRAEIARYKTIIFKPRIDNRYSEDHIVSHNQSKMESVLVETSRDVWDQARSYDVIGIDEAQFLDGDILTVCRNLAAAGKRVVIAGLDTDFRGQPFGPMPELMCEADYLDKLQAICVVCGQPATRTQRKTAQAEQVVIGETDIYEARCRHCFQPPEDL